MKKSNKKFSNPLKNTPKKKSKYLLANNSYIDPTEETKLLLKTNISTNFCFIENIIKKISINKKIFRRYTSTWRAIEKHSILSHSEHIWMAHSLMVISRSNCHFSLSLKFRTYNAGLLLANIYSTPENTLIQKEITATYSYFRGKKND